ncbi:PH domain-containing protein [Candidatus Woesearchaeota archaeon]|nr:PH domain-containing protein [Candidatus Woesearchaeota archaeon]MBW3016345.1 PH domain-containing protein [Candidatus Woesearchaeota archaeon]
MAFHFSRWRFWYGYLVILLLFLVAIWFYDSGGDVPAFIFAGIGVVLLLVFEFFIRTERLSIDESAVILTKGFFSRGVVRVSYNTISNVSVNQSFLQRILNYGDVMIDTPGGPGAEIVLSSFQSPYKIEKLIDERIQKAHAAHKHVVKK